MEIKQKEEKKNQSQNSSLFPEDFMSNMMCLQGL